MATCKQCREFEKCKDDAFINGAKFDPNESVKYCTGFEPITNSDRIRAMTDEELAYLIRCGVCELIGATQDHCETNTCVDCVLDWLKQPAEVDNG